MNITQKYNDYCAYRGYAEITKQNVLRSLTNYMEILWEDICDYFSDGNTFTQADARNKLMQHESLEGLSDLRKRDIISHVLNFAIWNQDPDDPCFVKRGHKYKFI